jgi:hypothetical protein
MHEERQENPEEGQSSKVQNQSNQHFWQNRRTEGTCCSLARMRAAASKGTAGQTAGLGHGNMLNAAL